MDSRAQPLDGPLGGLLEARLAALEAALQRGEHRVTFDDESIEYGSAEGLRGAIRAARSDLLALADLAGLGPRRSH